MQLEKAKLILASGILAAQVFGVCRMFFVEDRFFSWSPHDSRVDLQISAYHNGSPVSESEIRNRYGLPGIEWHALGNAKAVIRAAESRQPLENRWSVRLEYRRNLGAPSVWLYPKGIE